MEGKGKKGAEGAKKGSKIVGLPNGSEGLGRVSTQEKGGFGAAENYKGGVSEKSSSVGWGATCKNRFGGSFDKGASWSKDRQNPAGREEKGDPTAWQDPHKIRGCERTVQNGRLGCL